MSENTYVLSSQYNQYVSNIHISLTLLCSIMGLHVPVRYSMCHIMCPQHHHWSISSSPQSVTFKTTSRNLARAMCMKNLKLTVVIVLVALVSWKMLANNYMIKIWNDFSHSLMLLFLEWVLRVFSEKTVCSEHLPVISITSTVRKLVL